MYKDKLRKPVKRAYSSNPDLTEAIKEIKEGLGAENKFDLVMFFASPKYNPQDIAMGFKEAFPAAQAMGCSTAGESLDGKILSDSVVAMGFDKDVIKDFRIELVENVIEDKKIDKAMKAFEGHFGRQNLLYDAQKYVGLIISDGLSFKEESIISRLSQLTEIQFVGGSAADNWEMENAWLYYNGNVYNKAVILILLEPTVGFKVFKTQSFVPIGEVAVATKVDESNRCLKEVDGLPAGIFYARQLGCDKDEVSKYILDYSMGIIIYNEPYAHDIKKIDDNYNIYLFSAIPSGAEIQVLEAVKIVDSLRKVLKYKIEPLENISAIIDFNCGSRFLKIAKDNCAEEIEELWQGLPAIGFGTYGEYYISFINQTSVILVLF